LDNNTQNNIDSNESNKNVNRRRSSNRQRRSVTSREDSYNLKEDDLINDNQDYKVTDNNLDDEIDTSEVDSTTSHHRGRARRSHVDSELQNNADNASHSRGRRNDSTNHNDDGRYTENIGQFKKPNKTFRYIFYSDLSFIKLLINLKL
jgi:hypothetical protein